MSIDFADPATVSVYDEAPLWSSMFGLLLLEHVPMRRGIDALDVGCGTGFPLIELAERLGADSRVHGIDPWHAALERAREKLRVRGIEHVELHEGSAAEMPYADASFDLIVSNLGVNNFDDPPAVVAECRRVARDGAALAMTSNLQGHMAELYDAYADVLKELDLDDALLRSHIAHRATIHRLRTLLSDGGFEVTRIVEREGVMRFASSSALFQHWFIRLGFIDGWRSVVPADRVDEVFAKFGEALDRRGELRLTIPMAYVEAVAR